MQVTRGADVDVLSGPDPNFTGRAERRAIGRSDELPGGPSTWVVTFRDGARTRWHSHADGQLLYVLEGRGRVATHDKEVAVGPGDVVTAAPGEEHWHGADEGSDLTHVALSFGETTWGADSR